MRDLLKDPRPTICLLMTGGTIDKDYGTGIGVRDMEIGMPFAPNLLRKMIGTAVLFDDIVVCKKDSLDLDDGDRARIIAQCRQAKTNKILITHGTDTIILTAKALHEAGLGEKDTIVLTGAARPAVMAETDARFNLGLAVAACLTLPPGIYVALNGIHRWNQCEKHPSGLFISKE